jgi:hypothetical protein
MRQAGSLAQLVQARAYQATASLSAGVSAPVWLVKIRCMRGRTVGQGLKHGLVAAEDVAKRTSYRATESDTDLIRAVVPIEMLDR